MDSKYDANDLNRDLSADETADAAQELRPRKKRRPRNPDGTPVRRPRPARPAADDDTADGFGGDAELTGAEDDAAIRPRKKRRPRNPDGTPVRRPRPETAEELTEADEQPQEFADADAPVRPRKRRRPRPEGARSEAELEMLLNGGVSEDEVPVRRKRRPRPEDAFAMPEDQPEEAPLDLDLDWRNELTDEEEKPKKKSFFARLFGSHDDEEPEFDEPEFNDSDFDEAAYDEPAYDGQDEMQDGDYYGEDAAPVSEFDNPEFGMNEDAVVYRNADGAADAVFAETDDEADMDGEFGEYDDEPEEALMDYYDESEMPHKSRGFIIAVAAVCVAAVCVTVGCLVYIKGQPKKMLELLEKGDYTAAAEYYENHSYAESDDIDKTITTQVDSILQKYLNEESDYDSSIAKLQDLEKIQKMRSRNDYSCTDAVTLIHDSRVHYEAGKTALANNDYDTAIAELSKTCEADTKYFDESKKLIKQAQDGQEKLRNDQIQQIITDANKLAKENSDYLGAYKMFVDAAPKFNDDARLTSAREAMKLAYIEEKLKSADSLSAEHLYDDALKLLEIANTEMPDTLEIPAKINAIKEESEKYGRDQRKQQVLAEAAEAFDLYGPDNAIFILQSATDVANEQEIKDKIQEYENAKTTTTPATSVLKIEAQPTSVKNLPSAKTSKDLAISDVLQFQLTSKGARFGIFYSTANSGYTKFAFTAAPDAAFSKNPKASAVIKIYADGALVYTSNTITSETDPFKGQALFPSKTSSLRVIVESTSTLDPAAAAESLFVDVYGLTVTA